jgi:hypothetical protein
LWQQQADEVLLGAAGLFFPSGLLPSVGEQLWLAQQQQPVDAAGRSPWHPFASGAGQRQTRCGVLATSVEAAVIHTIKVRHILRRNFMQSPVEIIDCRPVTRQGDFGEGHPRNASAWTGQQFTPEWERIQARR